MSKKHLTLSTFTFLMLIAFSSLTMAQHNGLGFQTVIKKTDGTKPTVSGVSITAQILDPVNNCVLREEEHTGKNISNGYLNLVLGDGGVATPAIRNPSPVLTISQVLDNKTSRSGLKCVDHNNNIILTGQNYTPSGVDRRILRLRMNLLGEDIVADFNMRSVGFAVNSEMLNSKSDTDFININNSKGVVQGNIESIFERFTKLDSILNSFNPAGTSAGFNITGNASTATNVTGTVALANGGTGATTAAGARSNLGLGSLATISPTGTANGTTYLRGDGTWATVSGGAGAVDSVAGRTGTVVLTTSDLSDFNTAVDTRISGSSTVKSVAAAATANNPVVIAGTSTNPTVDLPAASSSVNGYLKSSDWSAFNNKQAGSTELSGIAAIALTGILQRTGSGTYETLGVAAPLNVTSGNIGLSAGSGLTLNSGSLVVDFATTSSAGKAVQANDARLPASACAAGNKVMWNGSAWSCVTDVADPAGSGIVAVANGGTGSNSGSITGTGAVTFTAGGTNSNINLVPVGTGTVDVASKRITNLATPTAATDAATKAYVDAAAGGGALQVYTSSDVLLGKFLGCAVPPCNALGVGFSYADSTGKIEIINAMDIYKGTTRLYFGNSSCTGSPSTSNGAGGAYYDGTVYFYAGESYNTYAIMSYRENGVCTNASMNIYGTSASLNPAMRCGSGCKVK